jgi:hypothetical protein
MKVYRTRSMFRIPGSKASKPGYYKIEITKAELFNKSFEDIRQLATTQRMMKTEHDPSKFDEQQFESWMKIETEKLPSLKSFEDMIKHNQTVAMEVTPCISKMLLSPALSGERNITIFVLGQFFRSCDIDQDSALNIILAQPHHAAFEQEKGEVSKVIRSLYKSRNPAMVGCKSSSPYAELMRGYCAAPCHFRDDFNHTPWRQFAQ